MKKTIKNGLKYLGKAINSIPLLVISSLFISSYIYLRYSFSKPIMVFLFTFIVSGSILAWPSKKLIEWVFREEVIYLLELGVEKNGIRLFKFPLDAWKKVDVVEGSLFETKNDERVFVCKRFNEKDFEASGSWRGSLNDIELLREKEKISELRDSLEDMAREGLVTRTKITSIVRGAINHLGQKMVVEAEKDLLFSGEEIQEVVEEELRKSDIYD